MSLSSGEKVFYKTLPEVVQHQATVVSADGETITLGVDARQGLSAGQRLVISSGERQYFGEVTTLGDDTVTLRQTWSNSREYFRVDDVVPFVARKLSGDEPLGASRSFPFSAAGPLEPDPPGPDVNPRVWQALANIQSMLAMILERLDMRTEGFLEAEKKRVNISATGIRFQTKDRFEIGDELEIKMLLPSRPPVGLLLYGSIVRLEDAGNGEKDIAMQFGDMSDELRDEIIQYALVRQRDIIRKARD
ncbi:MAG: PilZ domain-containing protein [Deltaproteobacteria bacterium]|nr:PilZ domain-containing protein [Deltaproteobacteria bacterium]